MGRADGCDARISRRRVHHCRPSPVVAHPVFVVVVAAAAAAASSSPAAPSLTRRPSLFASSSGHRLLRY